MLFIDRRGNVAIMFALALVPMIGLIGIGSDYARALRVKSALDAGIDAAALAAISTASQVISAQSTANNDATDAAISQGQVYGKQVFMSNVGAFVAQSNPQLTLSIIRNGLNLTENASYTAVSQNMIGGMFGSALMNIAGKASSVMNIPRYINVYVVIDISQSMGIGSTAADMSQLFSLTANMPQQGGGCVFGCHAKTGSQTTTNELVAHNHNLQLRIDAVRQATLTMINKAKADSAGTALIKIGLYTMQSGLNTLSSPTSDFNSLINQANQIELGYNNSTGFGDSNQSSALVNLAFLVSASGDGSGPNSPQTYVFILTDGVQDVPGSCTFGHCTQALDPTLCTLFKLKQATVGVIYTSYLPIYNDGSNPNSGLETNYYQLVDPFARTISSKMQSCASQGYYYEASNGPAIDQAVQTLFASATTMARLTQ